MFKLDGMMIQKLVRKEFWKFRNDDIAARMAVVP